MTLTDDLEIQGHVILHVTLPASASTHSISTHLPFILMPYKSGNLFQLVALSDDLEIQGQMILHVRLPISASTHAFAMNFNWESQ